MACGVRVMRRAVAEALPLYGDLHRFIPALALREGYRVDEVAVPQHPSDARTRVYGPGSTPGACSTSRLLLPGQVHREAAALLRAGGLGVLGLGRGHSAWCCWSSGSRARPSPIGRSCLAVLLVALGVQLMGLGLVGEIIVHLRAPHRRAYRVRERT